MSKNDIKYTWNLDDIFKSDEDFKSEISTCTQQIGEVAKLKGTAFSSPQALLKLLTEVDELSKKISMCYLYASSRYNPAMADPEAKRLMNMASTVYTTYGQQLSFLMPELMEGSMERFTEFAKQLADLQLYKEYFENLFENKKHILDEKGELYMAQLSRLQRGFDDLYGELTVNDMQYQELKSPDGTSVIANCSAYGAAMVSEDRGYRKEFFESLHNTYGKKLNTITTSYTNSVMADVFIAKNRGYQSARQCSLADNFIPEQVYDSLIDTVRAGTAPLHEYISLRKSVLGIDDFHPYDFFCSLVSEPEKKYTYEQAIDLTAQATAVLGDDYVELVKKSLTDRWTDVYPKTGKQSGAYSTGAYGVHPYMLLNFNETLDDVFTVAHELGHSMHTYFSNSAQPFIYSNYSIFCAEVASTTNELLLYHMLLENAQTNEEKKYLLAKHLDDLRSTFFRQTLFADFEYKVHTMVEKDEPILPDTLCELYAELNKIYYGAELNIDKAFSYEWARIPHFYRSFYVYQYATGIAAATAIVDKIRKNGKPAVENYRGFLSGGSRQRPIELLKSAGADMSSPATVQTTIDDFASTLEQLKKLV